MLEHITGGYKTTAKVVDDTLVMSFPDAENPSLWRMELRKVAGCVFELGENDDGTMALVHKDVQGKRTPIARFDNRAKAMRALICASKALEKGQGKLARGQIATARSNSAPVIVNQKGFPWGKILLVLLLLYLAYNAFVFFATLNAQTASMMPPAAPTQQQAQPQEQIPSRVNGATVDPGDRAGEPVSADELLRNLKKK